MKWITIFNVIQWFFIWGSLVMAVLTASNIFFKMQKEKMPLKVMISFVFCLTYILVFVVGKIFFSETFDMLASIIFIGMLIIISQRHKHEDRKAGRRGWYR